MLAIIFGLIFMILGIWGVIIWMPDFVNVIKGLVPFMFVCGGLITAIAGASGIAESVDRTNDEIKKEKI